MGYVTQFATISSTTEQQSTTFFDGAGRVRAATADLPNSAGGFIGQYSISDVMGQVTQQSNPTEINSGWTPTGDDSSGWGAVQQTYDWAGRPLVTSNQDGWTRQNIYG